MSNHSVAKPERFQTRFLDKLMMGMPASEYLRTLVTPFNLAAAVILSFGVPLIVLRFTKGLAAVTHASDEYPWSLLLGWGLFSGVPLSATGYIMATAVYIFGYEKYHPLVRLGVLTGFMGYLFAVIYLLIDIGRPWRIYYPMAVSYGPTSVLFLVAWHVALYLTVQLLEFSPAILEWLQSRRVRKWALMITVAMTIAGVILSTLHQSALGALFLLAPGKVHPLWYSPFLPVFFFVSSIYAGLAMVIAVSTVLARFLRKRAGREFLEALDPMTVGLGKGAAVVLFVYFALKWIGVAHDDHWGLLATPPGRWFLAEVFLFVLAPGVLLACGVKRNRARLVRIGAFWAIAGTILNRLNVSLIMFNWRLPDHLHHLVPPLREAGIVLTVATIHILLFRWIVNRMPVLREDPDYADHG
ncbi:MAG: polysulfide reductase NrfD [Deltaproteobacteria bacterium]